MSLESGTRLGSYEISSQIGKGGMGEVYRARDSKLGREVAIKVLPEEFAGNEERLSRFAREARLLASLNHPNIAAIYGLDQSGETRFLVLELVEGDTLADRLRRGAIPVEESLKLALQIAEAVEAAHEKGVIHRDLKPANLKITPEGRVKVLDFGLAKAFIGERADVDFSNSPTLSIAATQAGIILGTAAYMSPEQASGEVADHRADIWSFGVVLFEMLTGRQLFTGKTSSHIMGAVLEREPDWNSLPPNLHPLVRGLLERCLEKEPKNRRQTMTDVRYDLRKVLADPKGASPVPVVEARSASRLKWVAGIVLIGLLTFLAGWILKPAPAPEPKLVTRFPFILPEGQTFSNTVVRALDVSADGRRIAYTANGQVYLRELGEMASAPIRGTANPAIPTFSPDGQSLVYFEAVPPYPIVKVPVTGGTPVTIVPGTGTGENGLAWETQDEILLSQPEGIVRIPANGGKTVVVVPARDGERLANPHRLPDGSVLFVSSGRTGVPPDWDLGRISVQRGSERTVIYEGGSDPRYVPTGHIVFARGTTLFAFPFDLKGLKSLSGPVPLPIEDLSRSGLTDTAQYAFSNNGTLAQIPGVGSASSARTLVWVDRDGKKEPIAVPKDAYTMARISPNGAQVALTVGNPGEIWILDLETGTRRNLTLNPKSADTFPVWALDSRRIFFLSDRDDKRGIYGIPAEGGTAEFIAPWDKFQPVPWSMIDEKTLTVVAVYNPASVGVSLLRLDGKGAFEDRLPPDPMESEPALSPKGSWLAFQWIRRNQSTGVYFRPFPDVARAVIPGPIGGIHPVFSRDGSKLFFFDSLKPSISALDLGYERGLKIGAPKMLFSGSYWYGVAGPSGQNGRAWDLDPKTQRFLMLAVDEGENRASSPRINVTLNWFDELKRLAPVP